MQNKNDVVYKYLHFEMNTSKGANIHPPWFVHLVIADLVGSLFLREMRRCEYFANSAVLNPKERQPETMNAANIPLRTFTETAHCDSKFSVVLDARADEAVLGKSIVGTTQTSPGANWTLVTESRNRAGWIGFPPARPATHSIFFEAPFPMDMHHGTYVLKIHYLRTYENAGAAEVYMCGNFVLALNALWTDYQTRHISIAERGIYTDNIDFSGGKCRSDKLIVEIRQRSAYTNPPSVEPRRLPIGNEKFKIIGVMFCREH